MIPIFNFTLLLNFTNHGLLVGQLVAAIFFIILCKNGPVTPTIPCLVYINPCRRSFPSTVTLQAKCIFTLSHGQHKGSTCQFHSYFIS